LGWEGRIDEVVLDISVLPAREGDAVRLGRSPSGSADLLVVGNRRTGHLVMDHELDVRVVVPHAESRGGNSDFQIAIVEILLNPLARFVIDLPRVLDCIDPAMA